MSKVTFTATAPDGTVHPRTTARAYTHAVLVQRVTDGEWGSFSFNGSHALACKSAAMIEARTSGRWAKVIVVPVDAPATDKKAPASVKATALTPMGRRNDMAHADGRAAVAAVSCPICKARKGKMCKKADGTDTKHVHAVRFQKWESVQAEVLS